MFWMLIIFAIIWLVGVGLVLSLALTAKRADQTLLSDPPAQSDERDAA